MNINRSNSSVTRMACIMGPTPVDVCMQESFFPKKARRNGATVNPSQQNQSLDAMALYRFHTETAQIHAETVQIHTETEQLKTGARQAISL